MSTKFLISLTLGLLLAGQVHAMTPVADHLSEQLVQDKSASCPFKAQTILTYDAANDSAGFLNTGTCSRGIYKAQVRQFQNLLEEISAASSVPVNPSVIRGINPQPIPPEGLAFILTDLTNLIESIKTVTNNIDSVLVAGGYKRPAWQRALNFVSYGMLYSTTQPKSFVRSVETVDASTATATATATATINQISLVKQEEKK